jgi:thiosulfate reductase cytochrome b subunit
MSSQIVTSIPRNERLLHPLPLRITHWINAVAIFIMIGSGWKIYNDDAIFGFLHFPDAVVIGKWAQYGLQWHFFGMWILCSMVSPISATASQVGAFGKSCFRFRFARFSSRSAKRCGFA